MKTFGFTLLVLAVGCSGGGDPPHGDAGADASAPPGTSGSGDAGTSPDASISAPDYDRTCTADADCVLVYEGDACSSCRCANAAIAKADKAKYDEDLAAATAACGELSPCARDCASPIAYCNAGTCAVRRGDAPDGG